MKNKEGLLKLVFYVPCRVLCFHSPYHKTHVIYLTRDKSTYHHQTNVTPQTSCVPPIMTALTVRKEDRAPETPQDHFRWVQRGPSGPPICEIKCSTLFNPNGAARTAYGQILPNRDINGRFGGPLRPPGQFSMGPKGCNWSLHM